ncbi:50S ribosomal protein L24e [Candidatus Pacearchaeota archaeon]|nr:50S ribosomal protein L24e [Candidatus Pacearchaeota archaeon]
MVKCIFCGNEDDPFRGIHLIKNDGSISYFCSSKCKKNALKLKRDKRKLKWTSAYREEKEKAAKKAEETKNPPVAESKPSKSKKKLPQLPAKK